MAIKIDFQNVASALQCRLVFKEKPKEYSPVHTESTRRYPQGIQKLVSTYLLVAQFAGGVVFWASKNWKGVGGGSFLRWSKLKSLKMPRSV